MIEVEHLTKRYGDVVAVDDISFTVQARACDRLPRTERGRQVDDDADDPRASMPRRRAACSSTAADTANSTRRCARSAPCSTPAPSTTGERPPIICCGWPTATESSEHESATCSNSSGSPMLPIDVSGRSRSACASGSASPPPCSVTLTSLMFDEPTNGLDPDGIIWLRATMRRLAAEGRTVFVSSHLMSEVAQTADHVIVIGRGRIVADAPIDAIVAQHGLANVYVRAERQHDLSRRNWCAMALSWNSTGDGAVSVRGLDSAAIGAIAAAEGIALSELTPRQPSLEDAFFELTHDLTLPTVTRRRHTRRLR